MNLRFDWEGCTERRIALGRVVLASFSLLTIWLDPSPPITYAAPVFLLLVAYVFYALLIVLLVWFSCGPALRLTTHIFDLGIFSVFMYFTAWATSASVAFFVFVVLCATLRWQWRGAIWTAATALCVFLGMSLYVGKVLQDPNFELNRFIVPSIYLAVLAVFLGYFGVHEFQYRSRLAKLAAWPRTASTKAEEVLSQLLNYAAMTLNAPRVLMAWEESEEPWLHLATVSGGKLEWRREPPGTFIPLVAEPLQDRSFFSHDLHASGVSRIGSASGRLERWLGEPLNRELTALFNVRSVMSVNLCAENLKGRLFFLDKSSLNADELGLAELVAAQVAASMDLFYFLQRLPETAVEERTRLARDLHDGLLQSLTATGFQLQAALQLLEAKPEAVRAQLRSIQDLLVQEQRDLRSFIEELKPTTLVPAELDFKLGRVIEELAKTVEWQWSLRVEVKLDGSEEQVPATLAREIYHMIHEGLVNVARHSNASAACVELAVIEHDVRISISDNGRGFSFTGCYDHAALTAMGEGPATLKSRIAFLGGSLSIDSAKSGARLEITLPLSRPGA